jgi:hypothetical protein
MGISCGPPVFQREMQKAMAGLLGVCCLVYLDDLVIYSKEQKEHVGHVELVLERLREYSLTLKRTKCTFAAPVVELLGFVISADGISPNTDKVSAIAALPPPTVPRTCVASWACPVTIDKRYTTMPPSQSPSWP